MDIDANISAATGLLARTHKAFGLASEAAPRKSTAWRLPTQVHKMLP